MLTIAAFYRVRGLGRPVELLLACAIAAVFAWSFRRLRGWSLPTGVAFTLLLGIFVASRVAVLAWLPTEPVSDFHAYYTLAGMFATGEPLPSVEHSHLFFAWGYALVLTPLFAVFGPSILAAKVLNIVLGVVSLGLLCAVAQRVGGRRVAFAAGLLFVLWPTQAILTPVLASEHAALPMCLAYLLATLRACRRDRWGLTAAAGAGALLAVAVAIRPSVGVALPAALVVLLAQQMHISARIARAGALVLALVVVLVGYRAGLTTAFGRAPPNVGWYNLMVGLNIETKGWYSREDSKRYFSRRTYSERDALAKRVVVQRLRENWRRLPWLMRRKAVSLWATEADSVKWATARLAPAGATAWNEDRVAEVYAAAQISHTGLLMLATVGLIRCIRRAGQPAVLLLILLLLGGTALHMVFEVQPRYHYVVALAAIVFAAFAIANEAGVADQLDEGRRSSLSSAQSVEN